MQSDFWLYTWIINSRRKIQATNAGIFRQMPADVIICHQIKSGYAEQQYNGSKKHERHISVLSYFVLVTNTLN